MSETEQAMVIERMTQLEENDRAFIMGVIAGLAAKQEQQGSCCGKCGGEMCAESAADGSGQEGGAGPEG